MKIPNSTTYLGGGGREVINSFAHASWLELLKKYGK